MNIDDRELFELAAKASSVWPRSWWESAAYFDGVLRWWNPRDHDKDAFDLLVRLGLRLQFFSLEAVDDVSGKTVCSVSWVPGGEKNRTEEYLLASDADPNAAARLAVFLAAVEIGRRMK